MSLDKDAYLEYALRFSSREERLRDTFMNWLPETIIDSHAHCNRSEDIQTLSPLIRNHMMSTFASFDLEESMRIQQLFYPGKYVRTLRFCSAFKGIDHRAVNQYLLDESLPEDRIALYGLPDDIDYTVAMLQHDRVAGLKMYYLYFEPPAKRIYEYFRREILEEAQARHIPIILHPPQKLLQCQDQLQTLLEDFPRLRVVIAHLGLYKIAADGLAECYAHFAQFDNVSMDTALITSSDVIYLALRTFGTDRILFGSDEPLYLIRSRAYMHPTLGERLTTAYPYHWVNQEEQKQFGHLAKGAVHAQWEALSALKKAIDRCPQKEREEIKKRVFCDNARSIYGFE